MPTRIPPYLDTAIVALVGLIDLTIVNCKGVDCGNGGFLYISPIFAVPFILSAGDGFAKDQCRDVAAIPKQAPAVVPTSVVPTIAVDAGVVVDAGVGDAAIDP